MEWTNEIIQFNWCISIYSLFNHLGVGLASISYNGSIRIAAGVDESIVPATVPIRALVDKVSKELDILKKEFSV